MYFDFEDQRPDTPSLDRAMSRREGILLSVMLHLLALTLVFVLPTLPIVREALERQAQEAELRQAQLLELQRQREREEQRFVFVEPLEDLEALAPPELGMLSDLDRQARAPERAVDPANPLPFSQGNSANFVESPPEEAPAAEEPALSAPEDTLEPAEDAEGEAADLAEEAAAEEAAGDEGTGEAETATGDLEAPGSGEDLRVPADDAARLAARSPGTLEGTMTRRQPPAGPLSDALQNLERFVQDETFHNPGGGAEQFGPWIQFDTKGVEFGPWIRRFIAQIRRNWFVPNAARFFQGHSVLTFNVHRNGALTDVTIVQPAEVNAFNLSARNALLASDPTQPLPSEYPAEKAFFTVTFYYNERPPGY